MKILVLSDSHGNLKNLKAAVDRFSVNADVIVHCGDGTRGDAMWLKEYCKSSMVICVKGNCDFGITDLPDTETINLEGKKIMITHGHLYNAKFGLEKLSYSAEEKGADLVFFGHTHMPTDRTLGNVRLINPGSCAFYNPTCAVVEIDSNGNVLVNHVDVPK